VLKFGSASTLTKRLSLAFWQSLPAGLAAWVAYGQLARMTVQSNGMISALLRDHISRLEESRAWLMPRLEEFDLDVRRRFDEFDREDGGAVNVHWAAEYEAAGDTLASDIESYREAKRLPNIVDTGLSQVLVRVKAISKALGMIHRPASEDSDFFTGEEWKQLQHDAEKAEAGAGTLVEALLPAVKALNALFDVELKILRDRSAAVDEKLIAD
jgi:hypothetical protein